MLAAKSGGANNAKGVRAHDVLYRTAAFGGPKRHSRPAKQVASPDDFLKFR
jgi:hypothetical protein